MKFLHVVLCALIALVPNVFCESKVNVTIYYESLCPDSRRFIVFQLAPNYRDFLPYIDVEFIPFGKSRSVEHEGFISFECHHGPEECNGNEIHSCALSEATNNQTAAIEFVGCQMYTKSKGTSACADLSGLSYEKIVNCVSSSEGKVLQKTAEAATKIFATKETGMLASVPTIVYNSKFDKEKSKRSEANLVNVLCDEIKSVSKEHPSICNFGPKTAPFTATIMFVLASIVTFGSRI